MSSQAQVARLILLADSQHPPAKINDELVAVIATVCVIAVVLIVNWTVGWREARIRKRIEAVESLEARFAKCKSRAEAMLKFAKVEERDFTPFESQEFDRLMDQYDKLQSDLDEARRNAPHQMAPTAGSPVPHRTSEIEGLLYLQLLTMLSPSRDRHNRR